MAIARMPALIFDFLSCSWRPRGRTLIGCQRPSLPEWQTAERTIDSRKRSLGFGLYRSSRVVSNWNKSMYWMKEGDYPSIISIFYHAAVQEMEPQGA